MVQIGQRLKEKRIERKLTLSEVAIAIKIKPQFLEAIENGDYKKLPSPAYAHGFVRNYADYLGLPKVQTSALFKRDFDEQKAMKVLPDGISRSKDFPVRRLNIRNLMLGGLVTFLFLGFLLFQVRGSIIPPSLSISSPKKGSTVTRDITVSGKTDSNAAVTVNGESVFVNSNGEFSKRLNLFPGKTTIIVKSKSRLGKETTRSTDVTVKP